MTIGELKLSMIFHMIDARSSYSLLLGMPWIHGNGVIQGDTKPFTEVESHFADAKFYIDEDMVPEAFL
ncbi:hypothetical protein ACFX11_023255 [Malus domestica]